MEAQKQADEYAKERAMAKLDNQEAKADKGMIQSKAENMVDT